MSVVPCILGKYKCFAMNVFIRKIRRPKVVNPCHLYQCFLVLLFYSLSLSGGDGSSSVRRNNHAVCIQAMFTFSKGHVLSRTLLCRNLEVLSTNECLNNEKKAKVNGLSKVVCHFDFITFSSLI